MDRTDSDLERREAADGKLSSLKNAEKKCWCYVDGPRVLEIFTIVPLCMLFMLLFYGILKGASVGYIGAAVSGLFVLLVGYFLVTDKSRCQKSGHHVSADRCRLTAVAEKALVHERGNALPPVVETALADAANIDKLKAMGDGYLDDTVDATDIALRVISTVHRVRMLVADAPSALRADMAAELQETLDAAQAEADALTVCRTQLEALAPSLAKWAALRADGKAQFTTEAARHQLSAAELGASADRFAATRELIEGTLASEAR